MSSIIVNVKDLRPGQILAEDVLNPSGQPLLCRGTRFSERMIRVVQERGYAQFLRISPGEEQFSEIEEDDLQSGGLPVSVVREVRHKLLGLLEIAAQTNSLTEAQVEKLGEDISPVIRGLFEGRAPVFDNLCVLSEHDDYTHQHSWMVMVMALAVLRGAWDRGLVYPDAQYRLDTGLGAVLHDLGKTQIPLEVLNKPGKLNREEWELIKSHPEKGYLMIRQNQNLMPLAKAIVAHHHQALDGSGYGPGQRALSAKEIPDLVRMVTIVDIYDALVSERPYRLGYLPFQALRFLEANSGSKLDRRFLHVLRMTVVDFPKGAILLFSHGLIGCVTKNFQKEKENPEILIIGVLCRSSAPLIGRNFRLQEQTIGFPKERDILLGAATMHSLAEKIRREAREKGLATLVCPFEERTLMASSGWEELLENHLGFLCDRDGCAEIEEPSVVTARN